MTAAIIIGIIIIILLIVYALSRGESTKPELPTVSNSSKEPEESFNEQLVQELTNNITLGVNTQENPDNSNDDSIIDVTDQPFTLNVNSSLLKYSQGVPFWAHRYVYSNFEINYASSEQKRFYETFKNSFLNGEHLDLEGNTNYAFILLFDLLIEYDRHRDIAKLESQLKSLGQHYPKTKSYGASFLKKKIGSTASNEAASGLNAEGLVGYSNHNSGYNEWGLGGKFKTKLTLNGEEVKLLNKLSYPSNSFCNIEFCLVEVIKLYLEIIRELESCYVAEKTSTYAQFRTVADVIATCQFQHQKGTQSYKYCVEILKDEFHANIFKQCENAVRELYGHKRKINTATNYTSVEAKAAFETRIVSIIQKLIARLILKVPLPDEATNIELNSQNTNRWKIRFEEITKSYDKDPEAFIDSIIVLGKENRKNPSLENIYFEASKFIAKHDNNSALILYIHYLYYDLKSGTFNNKQLTKTIQKSLFKSNEQLHEFERVVSALIKDRNLDKALKEVSNFYKVKRKKINLDTASIKEVQQQHSGTVEMLNEYLKDDFEDENISIQAEEISNEEIEIKINQKNETSKDSAFVSNISFSPIHLSALEFFSRSNFSVPQSELEQFAKSKGIFRNQLVESINETCYDFLDDVLIEEEDDFYTINTNYFQKISIQ